MSYVPAYLVTAIYPGDRTYRVGASGPPFRAHLTEAGFDLALTPEPIDALTLASVIAEVLNSGAVRVEIELAEPPEVTQ